MKQFLTALTAATEAATIVVFGLLIFALPALGLWLGSYTATSTLLSLASLAVTGWLLGHTVPVALPLPQQVALEAGLPESFVLPFSLPLLGALLVTLWLGWRLGIKYARAHVTDVSSAAAFGKIAPVQLVWRPLVSGLGGAVIGFAALVSVLVVTVPVSSTTPQLWQIVKPTLWFAAAVCGGAGYTARFWLGQWITPRLRLLVQPVWRVLRALLAGYLALAAVALTLSAMRNYVDFVWAAERLQVDVLALLLLFIVQLLLLPVLLVWMFAWLTGVGFQVGQETLYSPFVTVAGPLPDLPLLQLVPQQSFVAAWLLPVSLVLVATAVGYAAVGYLPKHSDWQRAGVLSLTGLFAGVVVAWVTSVAVGSLGPLRLTVTGADPLQVGAVTVAVSVIGLLLGGLMRAGVPRVRQEAAAGWIGVAAPEQRNAEFRSGVLQRLAAGVAAGVAAVKSRVVAQRSSQAAATAPHGAGTEAPESGDEAQPVMLQFGADTAITLAQEVAAAETVTAGAETTAQQGSDTATFTTVTVAAGQGDPPPADELLAHFAWQNPETAEHDLDAQQQALAAVRRAENPPAR